jgi:hypothetical protein
MGSISNHNCEQIRKQYNLKLFVETGTGLGSGLSWALNNTKFKAYFSCEYYEEVFKKITINHHKCFIFNTHSVSFFRNIEKIIQNTPCLFWLDAHFPGADFGFEPYLSQKYDESISMPLIEELKFLFKHKNISKDVFIIDDWRCYEDLSYASGKCFIIKEEQGKEIISMFQNTHEIEKNLNDQGYLICKPKIS